MFRKLLIANRAEIACRIIRTAKKLGIQTVAVFSEADQHAEHVSLADEAFCIGPAPSKESYLKGNKIIEIAKQTGATAIHPGYGFLAENTEFAKACAKAGITFIGPQAETISQMGEKNTAKALMEKASIPTLPGYHGAEQDKDLLLMEAGRIGFPLLIKAISGGGGKGMRIVNKKSEFSTALAGAQREAKNSFGDDRVLLEKYLANPRHIEVQVFGDQHGNVIHLFERDCSIQRRHQKILEEAPAPGLSDKLRKKIAETAVQAAQSINYIGAGTIELLLDEDDAFYFMEMNTRLQVEHPITEMITNLDLVEWQLRVAAGESLPKQESIHCVGHAFEARIYAEDPSQNYMPSIGKLSYFSFPDNNNHVRLDAGFKQGDQVTPHYDAMLAKLITHNNNREHALADLSDALNQSYIAGVTTNITQLKAIIAQKDYKKGKLTTHFIHDHEKNISTNNTLTPDKITLSLAALAIVSQQRSQLDSPWHQDAWRLNAPAMQHIALWHQLQQYNISLTHHSSGFLIGFDNHEIKATIDASDRHSICCFIEQQRFQAHFALDQQLLTLFTQAGQFQFSLINPAQHAGDQSDAASHFLAPMPGVVVDLLVKDGQQVKKGDSLLVIEAMKMEHIIYAPADGVINKVHFQKGDQMKEGEELLEFNLLDN